MGNSVLEMPRRTERPPVATSSQPTPVTPDTQNVVFSPEAIAAFHRDDAMASTVIAIVLSCAFLVLLCLAIAANVWTTFFAG